MTSMEHVEEFDEIKNKVVVKHRQFIDFFSNPAHALFLLSLEHTNLKTEKTNIEALDDDAVREGLGKAFYLLAKVFYDKCDFIEAKKYFLKAAELGQSPTNNFTLLKIYGFLIRISSERMESELAQKYIGISKNLLSELGEVLGTLTGEYFYNYGVIKNYSGDFEKAKEYFAFAYEKSKTENEADLHAKCLLSLAILSYNQGHYSECLESLNKLDQLLDIIKKSYLKGAMYYYKAKVYTKMDEPQNAMDNFQLANIELRSKKCWNLHGYIMHTRGILYKNKGEYEKSLKCFEYALETVDPSQFLRLTRLIENEIKEVRDDSVDIYFDRVNRKITERILGTIDFKHRFVLLEILFLLAKNAGKFYDKEDLAKSIWQDEYNPLIHDKLIYTSVSRLRKLIEPKNVYYEDGERLSKRKYIMRGKDGYTFNPRAKIRFHREEKFLDQKTIANVEITSPV